MKRIHDVLQSFLTILSNKKYRLLCNVTIGVFTIKSDGSRCYELTDPVIHKHRKKNKKKFQRLTFGRTDRGEKGMKAFFETHVCTDVCRLLGLSEVNVDDIHLRQPKRFY